MGTAETELEMVRRHVRNGERLVTDQRALLARLRTSGLPIEEAEALLGNLEDVQRMHEAHLVRIEGERG